MSVEDLLGITRRNRVLAGIEGTASRRHHPLATLPTPYEELSGPARYIQDRPLLEGFIRDTLFALGATAPGRATAPPRNLPTRPSPDGFRPINGIRAEIDRIAGPRAHPGGFETTFRHRDRRGRVQENDAIVRRDQDVLARIASTEIPEPPQLPLTIQSQRPTLPPGSTRTTLGTTDATRIPYTTPQNRNLRPAQRYEDAANQQRFQQQQRQERLENHSFQVLRGGQENPLTPQQAESLRHLNQIRQERGAAPLTEQEFLRLQPPISIVEPPTTLPPTSREHHRPFNPAEAILRPGSTPFDRHASSLTGRGHRDIERNAAVADDYRRGMSLRQVAERHNISHIRARQLLLRDGVELRMPGRAGVAETQAARHKDMRLTQRRNTDQVVKFLTESNVPFNINTDRGGTVYLNAYDPSGVGGRRSRITIRFPSDRHTGKHPGQREVGNRFDTGDVIIDPRHFENREFTRNVSGEPYSSMGTLIDALSHRLSRNPSGQFLVPPGREPVYPQPTVQEYTPPTRTTQLSFNLEQPRTSNSSGWSGRRPNQSNLPVNLPRQESPALRSAISQSEPEFNYYSQPSIFSRTPFSTKGGRGSGNLLSRHPFESNDEIRNIAMRMRREGSTYDQITRHINNTYAPETHMRQLEVRRMLGDLGRVVPRGAAK